MYNGALQGGEIYGISRIIEKVQSTPSLEEISNMLLCCNF